MARHRPICAVAGGLVVVRSPPAIDATSVGHQLAALCIDPIPSATINAAKNSTQSGYHAVRRMWDIGATLCAIDGTIAPHAVAPHGFACLSVCIAARNEAGCIGRCIASVRRAFAACDGATLEVIVADGGSTDATADIARDLGAAVVASSGGGRGGAFVDAVASFERRRAPAAPRRRDAL